MGGCATGVKRQENESKQVQITPQNLIITSYDLQDRKQEQYEIRRKVLPNNLKVKIPRKMQRKESPHLDEELLYEIREQQTTQQFKIKIIRISQSSQMQNSISRRESEIDMGSQMVNEQHGIQYNRMQTIQPIALDINQILINVIKLSQLTGSQLSKKQSLTNDSDNQGIQECRQEQVLSN